MSPSQTSPSLSLLVFLSLARDEEIKVLLGPAILAPGLRGRDRLAVASALLKSLGGRYRVRLRAAPALSPAPVWSPWTEAADSVDS